jgi:CheY-like chemotaxis protein
MTRVLVLDDDLWQLQQHCRVLIQAGMTCIPTQSPQAAMERVEEAVPDVIVIDMLLQENSALPLLHELQSHIDLSRIPCIVCSNIVQKLPTDMSRYGVRRVLDKTTMHPSDLVTAVKAVS